MDYNFSELTKLPVDKKDWAIHYVNGAEFKKNMCDCHTHGLDERIGTELQMVLHVGQRMCGFVINSAVSAIAGGTTFNDGDRLFGLFEDGNMPVGFIKSSDCDGKDILRICLPDESGDVSSNASGVYGMQHLDPYL